MKLGVTTNIYPQTMGLSLPERFERIAAQGFHYINVGLTAEDRQNWSKRKQKEAVQALDDLGLKVSQGFAASLHNVCFAEPHTWKRVMDELKRGMEFVNAIGAKQIGWIAGTFTTEYPWERSWVASVDFAREAFEWIGRMGVSISMEVWPRCGCLCDTLEHSMRYLEQVDRPNFFLNIDTGCMAHGRHHPRELEKYAAHVIHSHITDNDGWTREQELTIGTGTVDQVGYLRQLIRQGIDENAARHGEQAVATIELRVTNPDESLRQSVEYLSQVIPEIQQ